LLYELKKKKKPYMAAKGEPRPGLYKCMPCGYIYDDSKMEPKFDELSDSYRCPLCSARTDAFIKMGMGG